MLELIVLNPPRKRRPKKKKRKRVARRGHLGAASRWARPTRPKRKKKAKPKKRKPVARKKTKRKTKRKTRKKASRRKAPRRKTKRKKTTRRRKRRASPGKSKSRIYRPRIRRGARVGRTTKRRIARVVGRRYAKTGRGGAVRLNKRRRRRRNPARGIRGITRQIRDVFSVKTLITISQGLIGMSLAGAIPHFAAKATKQSWITRGYTGVASIAVASVVASAGASYMGFRAAAPKILAGGLLVAGSQGLRMILPAQWKKWIPQIITNGSSGGGSSYGGPRLSGGYAPMGAVMSPDQLVSGEDRSRAQRGLGDWMTLGQTYSVPRASIAGGHGLGDYMYFQQYPSSPQAIGIPQFSPSTQESF